jgi:hypothetical protein
MTKKKVPTKEGTENCGSAEMIGFGERKNT